MNNESIKVLLIEDNKGDAILIQEMLKDVEKLIFQVKHAQTLSDGIDYLQDNDFNIILLIWHCLIAMVLIPLTRPTTKLQSYP